MKNYKEIGKKSKRIVKFSVLLFVSSIILFSSCKNEENNKLLKIGDVIVLKEDLKYRLDVYKHCYKEVKTDSSNIVAELIRDNLELAVLMSAYKISPPDSILEKKSNMIDKNTQAPDILKCIKSVYKDDKAAYYRNLVGPTLVNPQLHDLFSKDNNIHKIKSDSVKLIQNQVINEKKINTKLPGYKKFVVLKTTKKNTTLEKYNVNIPPDPLIEKVLIHLKPGEISNDVYTDEYSYRIVRLILENDTSYVCDGIIFEKEPFDTWYVNYITKKIIIEVFDKDIYTKLKDKYSNVWWWSLVKKEE